MLAYALVIRLFTKMKPIDFLQVHSCLEAKEKVHWIEIWRSQCLLHLSSSPCLVLEKCGFWPVPILTLMHDFLDCPWIKFFIISDN
jgi:hypothetical protein